MLSFLSLLTDNAIVIKAVLIYPLQSWKYTWQKGVLIEHAEFFTIITFKKYKIWLTINFISCELTCPKNSNFHISEADKAKVVLQTKVISGKVDLLFSKKEFCLYFPMWDLLEKQMLRLIFFSLTFQMWNSHLKYSFVGLFSPADLCSRQYSFILECSIKLLWDSYHSQL